jgi:hypothetical protein
MLKLTDFEWYPDRLILRMENGYSTQLFGKLMKEKSLIENDVSIYQGMRLTYQIPHTYSINQLLDFIKEFETFDWNIKCYEETN